ncbi:twitchin [Eurytemora carolleeae]|uniref:twitchin n=1 Tax=Eurytemora carolleeae TaxID=1294199 RepID=UPI000C780942|nr:twitchin [Eurytemora carolleeae]|eukprot:XP_023322319.1 twitchin-like [Eurytemora affinis]
MTRPEDSSPLVPKGFGAPKFPECCQDKFLANEDENAYVQLEIFGDPAPTVKWLKDELDLCSLDRFKSWTDGKKGLAFLGVENAQKEDEGIYRCLIKNRFGKREHKFKLFIARSWQERKGPPKREVPIYWSEVPRTKFTKEGLLDKISFTAKLTVADKSAKWFFNNKECVDQNKYEIQRVGSSFTITIHSLEHADTGCYRCTLNEVDLSCETYLDVQLPDPEYSFLKPLVPLVSGYTGRQIRISCLSSQDAQVSFM